MCGVCARACVCLVYCSHTCTIAGEVQRRFDQADLKIVKEIEVLLLNATNGEVVQSLPSTVLDYVGNDFDQERLKCQLIKTATDGSINKVTHIRTNADIMHIYRGMLSEVFKLLKLFFTFPVTTATAERSFSSLRRLKTFLRSQMSDCRLNNLFLLYVHNSRTDELDLKEIAKEFVCQHNKLFWKMLTKLTSLVVSYGVRIQLILWSPHE